MKNNYKKLHILTGTIVCLVLMILAFTCNNPVILLGLFITVLTLLLTGGGFSQIRKGIIYFVPLLVITLAINVFFAPEGSTQLFSIFGKGITLEAVISGGMLAFKLLLVIYIFMLISIMVNSDRAVAYFSSKMPKSTLMLIIGLKLFPNMKHRFGNLKEIYSIRGLDFEEKKIKDRVKSYIPVLSILLENSLEGAFDIGEAVYVKGFLSGSRSIYDRQRFRANDYTMISISAAVFASYIIIKFMGFDSFDPYLGLQGTTINSGVLLVLIFLGGLTAALLILNKENLYGKRGDQKFELLLPGSREKSAVGYKS